MRFSTSQKEAAAKIVYKVGFTLRKPGKLWKALVHPINTFKIIVSPFTDVKLKSITVTQSLNMYRNTFDSILRLSETMSEPLDIKDFLIEFNLNEFSSPSRQQFLGQLFKREFSDKDDNGYTVLYQLIIDSLLASKLEILSLAEIGLGSNNLDMPSNMGLAGKPGASVKAFTAFSAKIHAFGGDVDKRILFESDRIKTFWVDQLNHASLQAFVSQQTQFDLLIDDGLHSYEANLNTVLMCQKGIRRGGWLVIEDVNKSQESVRIWSLVSTQLFGRFQTALVSFEKSYIYVMRRL